MITITPIDADQMALLCTKLAQTGTQLTGGPEQYSVYNSEHDIRATATFDPSASTLTVNITNKSAFFRGMYEKAVTDGIEKALRS